MDIITIVVSLATAAGLGSVIGAYFQSRFIAGTQRSQQQQELKQKRYLCILVLMLTKLSPKVGMSKIHTIRPDLQDTADIDAELETELLNALVFASDKVMKTLSDFIRTPNHVTFTSAGLAMRRDLWGEKTKLPNDFLELIGT